MDLQLWHVSEEAGIARFEPRAVATHDSHEPLVWAIDDEHVPAYWFPRDVPRGTFWAAAESTDADVDRFLDPVAGYFVSRESVEPVDVLELTDLPRLHDERGIELRVVDDLWSLWSEVIDSSLAFSGIRLRNVRGRGRPARPRSSS